MYISCQRFLFFLLNFHTMTDRCVYVWITFFSQRESLISSQLLFEVGASDINVLMSPFDFACANLVLLLPVQSESEAVSISVNQSSNCEESFLFSIAISWSKEFTKNVFFWALHKVFVYLFRTSPMGSAGVGRWSVRPNWLSLHSKWLMACIGSLLLASTVCSNCSILQVKSFNPVWWSGSILSKSFVTAWLQTHFPIKKLLNKIRDYCQTYINYYKTHTMATH